MFNSNRVRGAWWVCAALAGLLAVGCVSAALEESGGNSPASVGSSGAGAGSVPSSSGSLLPPPGGGVVSAEVGVSEEGLERLRRVLGEDKFAGVLEDVEWLAEFDGVDSGVWLGRLAGENGFLTEEGLGKLAERRSAEDLAWAAHFYSEEVLAEYANESEERMAGPSDTDVSDFEGRFVDEYSDDDVKAYAFYERAQAELGNRLWEDNDLSTPVGAFCWAVLRVRHIDSRTVTVLGDGFRPWQSRNLEVWHLEREAEERGIELEWETPPLDADLTLRRVLLEATAPEIRSVVFARGLPSMLRPAAEALYSVYDELLALPVRRVRPTVEELSAYRRLQDLTEEEIAQIWPAELELDYREEDEAKYLDAMDVLRDDEVRDLLNAECKEHSLLELERQESACPPWKVPETAKLNIRCGDGKGRVEGIEEIEDMMKGIDGPIISCPIFYKADTREASNEELQSECTINEEAAEAIERLSELMKRESGR